MPSLTVAIPTFRRPESLMRLLRSIMTQVEASDEVLVIDDSGDSKTEEALKSFEGVTYHRNASNLGMVASWNLCLERAAREWVCIIHDDDTLTEGGLGVLRRACALAASPALVTHRFMGGFAPDEFRVRFAEPGSWSVLHCPTIPSGAVVHRSIPAALGPFDPAFRYSADLEFFPRICQQYPLVIIENPQVVEWNVHGQNHQFRTWLEPDFFEQLEKIENKILSYARIAGAKANESSSKKLDGTYCYMFEEAQRFGHQQLVRQLGRSLSRRRTLPARTRIRGYLAAVTGR